MPSSKMNGKYSITQVLSFTRERFATRFKNVKRDHVKMIKVKTIKYYSKDRPDLPVVQYEIISQSTPQYRPYASGAKDKRGKKRNRQHSIQHQYTIKLLFGKGGMSLSNTNWKMVVGSLRNIPKNIPQDKIGSIFRETSKKWKKKYSAEEYKKKVRSHKRKAQYIDKGDFLAQRYGINGDFLYRQAYVFEKNGHLYGRNYSEFRNQPPIKTNPQQIMFFGKHEIAMIKILLQKGILTR